MDIDFFRQDSPSDAIPGQFAPHNGRFAYTTGKHEPRLMVLLQDRGFLDAGSTVAEKERIAANIWNNARIHLAPPLKDRLFSPDIELPEGTALDLYLLPPVVAGWGTANLTGQTVNAAWKEIAAWLKLGRCALEHAGPLALLNHIANTDVRNALGIRTATTKDLNKPIQGALHFRATPVRQAPMPVAPGGKGVTLVRDWVLDVFAFVGRAKKAVEAIDFYGKNMAADLLVLEKLRRLCEAIFHIGTLDRARCDDFLTNHGLAFQKKNKPMIFALAVYQTVLVPSRPGGAFPFAWTLADTDVGKAFAEVMAERVDTYKSLAKDFKVAPAAHLSLVNDVCRAELGILTQLVADGDPRRVATDELTSAIDWFAAAPGGDPPAAAGGLGVLLGMFDALADDVPVPNGLFELLSEALLMHGTLSAPDTVTRAAREARMKGSVARLLALDSVQTKELKHGAGWSWLLNAALAKKVTATFVRGGQISEKTLKRLDKLSKVNAGRFADGVAWLRAVGFLASGIGVLQDIWKLGSALDSNGHVTDAAEKTAKDTLSLFGSLARDYWATRIQLDPKFDSLSKQAKDELKEKYGKLGAGLGVASGLWTFYNGVQKKDALLEAGGFFGALGYGLRWYFGRDALLVLGAFELALPLLLIGAAFEIWAALQPKTADDEMKELTMALINGVVKVAGEWYASRYGHRPWRAVDAPAFDSALAAVKQIASECEDDIDWSDFLPVDVADKLKERARLVDVGFEPADAAKLIPDESAIKYLVRVTPPYWPPAWPEFPMSV